MSLSESGGAGRAPRSRRLVDRPYILLVLTVLFWSGNFILGRAVHADVPPVALAFFRWAGAFLIVVGFAVPHLRREWPVLLRHWRMLLLLSAVGIAAFNTLVYIGLGATTAINALLLQSALPVLIILFSYLLFGERTGVLALCGIAVSLAGVVTILTGGEPLAIVALVPNAGDVLVFLAVTSYALYSALLRRRPSVHALSFLAVTFGLGAAMLLPFWLWELSAGAVMRLDRTTLLSIGYVAVFPSVLAYFCYNRGVQLIGANRAGQFIHLMPVCGSLLAVLILGEAFRPFHAVGMGLCFAGIVLATRGRA